MLVYCMVDLDHIASEKLYNFSDFFDSKQKRNFTTYSIFFTLISATISIHRFPRLIHISLEYIANSIHWYGHYVLKYVLFSALDQHRSTLLNRQLECIATAPKRNKAKQNEIANKKNQMKMVQKMIERKWMLNLIIIVLDVDLSLTFSYQTDDLLAASAT